MPSQAGQLMSNIASMQNDPQLAQREMQSPNGISSLAAKIVQPYQQQIQAGKPIPYPVGSVLMKKLEEAEQAVQQQPQQPPQGLEAMQQQQAPQGFAGGGHLRRGRPISPNEMRRKPAEMLGQKSYAEGGETLHSKHPTIQKGWDIAMQNPATLYAAFAKHPDPMVRSLGAALEQAGPEGVKWLHEHQDTMAAIGKQMAGAEESAELAGAEEAAGEAGYAEGGFTPFNEESLSSIKDALQEYRALSPFEDQAPNPDIDELIQRNAEKESGVQAARELGQSLYGTKDSSQRNAIPNEEGLNKRLSDIFLKEEEARIQAERQGAQDLYGPKSPNMRDVIPNEEGLEARLSEVKGRTPPDIQAARQAAQDMYGPKSPNMRNVIPNEEGLEARLAEVAGKGKIGLGNILKGLLGPEAMAMYLAGEHLAPAVASQQIMGHEVAKGLEHLIPSLSKYSENSKMPSEQDALRTVAHELGVKGFAKGDTVTSMGMNPIIGKPLESAWDSAKEYTTHLPENVIDNLRGMLEANDLEPNTSDVSKPTGVNATGADFSRGAALLDKVLHGTDEGLQAPVTPFRNMRDDMPSPKGTETHDNMAPTKKEEKSAKTETPKSDSPAAQADQPKVGKDKGSDMTPEKSAAGIESFLGPAFQHSPEVKDRMRKGVENEELMTALRMGAGFGRGLANLSQSQGLENAIGYADQAYLTGKKEINAADEEEMKAILADERAPYDLKMKARDWYLNQQAARAKSEADFRSKLFEKNADYQRATDVAGIEGQSRQETAETTGRYHLAGANLAAQARIQAQIERAKGMGVGEDKILQYMINNVDKFDEEEQAIIQQMANAKLKVPGTITTPHVIQ